jgi:serine/threonine-protein kinase
MPSFPERLAERKIAQWSIAYLAGAWALLQVLDFVAGHFGWPGALVRAATVFLGIGFFAAVAVAWYHGEKGEQRVARSEVFVLTGILVVASAAALVTWRHTPAPSAQSVAPAGALTTVAVLPFENIGGDPQDEYFSEGMTDELAHALGQISAIRVAGRTSSYAFKGKAVPLPEIGRTLDVAGVIAGTVRRSGAQLRLTAQLANTSDGKVIWTHTYQTNQTDVFAVQDSFTQAIVSALLPHLSGRAARAAQDARGTTNEDAYNAYMLGRFFWVKRGAPNLDHAARYFKHAIAQDPSFARAHAALAMTYGVLPSYRPDPANRMRPLVLESAERALSLDSTLADAHLALALAYDRDLRFRESEKEYRKAIQLDPSSSSAYQWLSETLQAVGETEEAVAVSQRALELDPINPVITVSGGAALLQARRFRDALALLLHGLELDPSLTWGSINAGVAQVFLGHADSAVALLEPIYRRSPAEQNVAAMTLLAYAAAGRWSDAERVRAELRKPGGDPSGGAQAAYAEMVFGDPRPLLDLLETPSGPRLFYDTFAWFGCNPMLEPLRNEPRYVAALRKLDIQPCPLTSPWPVRVTREALAHL